MSRLTEGYNKKIKNLTRKQKMCIIILSLKGGFMIFMDKKDKASISIMKIIGVSLIIILLLGVTVRATETSIRTVEITLANGYKMSVITSKTNVYEILEDNNIFVEEDERVSPGLDDDINESNKIVITNKSVQEVQIAKISESGIETTLDEILKGYSPIVEKIEVEQEIIPYETITKDASQGATDTKNRVIQQGQDGLKEVTYKTKYQNDEQIEKIVLSEEIIKEPIDRMNSKILDMDYTVGEVELTYKSTSKSRNKIYSSEDAYEVLLSTYREGTICYKEYFKVLFLNQAKQVLGYTLISEGGITDTTVDVRVILQAALLTNSVALILAHNHPSGSMKPSRQDIEITKQVKEAARLMRITVLDHLILTDTGYYSFADEGEL